MQLSKQRLEYEMSPFIEKALSKVIKQAFCTSHHTDDGGRINIHREGALMVFFLVLSLLIGLSSMKSLKQHLRQNKIDNGAALVLCCIPVSNSAD